MYYKFKPQLLAQCVIIEMLAAAAVVVAVVVGVVVGVGVYIVV